jgi:chemotaxis protein methyltransferase CheR
MKYNLTDIEFSTVSEGIASRLGLYFPIERRAMLGQNLASAATEFGFQNMKGFIQWLLSARLEKDQINILASYLTISETYFWREPYVFDAFSQNTLKELVASRTDGNKSINIWCAGCSTGEEAYSIAIALHRTILEIKDWRIKILATDINSKSLSKAKTGVYSSWSFRNAPSWLKSIYFKKTDANEFEVIPEIKKMVTFSNFNLTQDNFLSSICKTHKMDVIFCRNVLMYFTSEWAKKVSYNFFHSLSDVGWLVVSSCELSSDLFPQLTPVNFPGAVLYRKGKAELYSSNTSLQESNDKLLFNSLQPLTPATERWNQLLSSDSGHPVFNEYDSLKTSPPILPEPLTSVALAKEVRSVALAKEVSFLTSAKDGQQPKSLQDSPDEKIASIRLLANKGELEEALLTCDAALISHKLTPGLYFLRASILQEQDKRPEAIKSLKQAIYIDPDYIMGHFTLGNLFIQQGIVKASIRHFKNALELLNRISNDEIPAGSEGISSKHLKEIIYKNICKLELT